jgi:hypothetical protein
MYIRLLVQCHLHPIWPPVLPLNLTYILKFLPYYPERTCPIHTSDIPCTKSHVHFLSLRLFIQGICPSLGPILDFRNKLTFCGEELLAPHPTPRLEEHPLLAVRNCLFNIFAAAVQNWEVLFHPQPEDTPCRGDKGPT